MSNVIRVERVNLSGGPLDGETVPVMCDQDVFRTIIGNREHGYLRIGNMRNFAHVSVCEIILSEDFETVGMSMFQDKSPSTLKSILSISWIHRLRSRMG